MDLICGICMEKLDSEKDVRPSKHIDCLKKWSEEQKNCWQRFQPAAAVRKSLYFARDPNSDNQTNGKNNETEQNDSAPATNDALKQQLDESKAEVDAAQTRVNDLEESIRELEKKIQDYEAEKQQLTNELHTLEGKNRETQTRVKGLEETNSQLVEKFRNSEDQRQEISERNRQLTAELQTSEGKNQATLERNRELEQELSNSRARARELEETFDQRLLIEKKKSESLKNCEVSRLQDSLNAKNIELENERQLRLGLADQLSKKNTEVANLSDKNAKVKQCLRDIQKRLRESEKIFENFDETIDNAGVKRDLSDNSVIIQDNAKMGEQLTELQRYHRKIGEASKFGDGIGKENQEPTNSQSLPHQSPQRLLPSYFRNFWNGQNQEPGSNGNSAKRSRMDTKKKPEEDDAKNATNVASGSEAGVNS